MSSGFFIEHAPSCLRQTPVYDQALADTNGLLQRDAANERGLATASRTTVDAERVTRTKRRAFGCSPCFRLRKGGTGDSEGGKGGGDGDSRAASSAAAAEQRESAKAPSFSSSEDLPPNHTSVALSTENKGCFQSKIWQRLPTRSEQVARGFPKQSPSPLVSPPVYDTLSETNGIANPDQAGAAQDRHSSS